MSFFTKPSVLNESAFTIKPLTGSLGAEILGIDLAQITEQQFRAVKQALLDHEVLVFRDQHLSREQHVALGRRFGELHVHPMTPGPDGFPEIFPVSAGPESSAEPSAIRRGKRAVNGSHWHSDVSCDEEPPKACLLYLKETPSVGGDTLFASASAAYADLSPPLQQLLEKLTALHSGEKIYSLFYASQKPLDRSQIGYRNGENYPFALHPLIRTHPESGKRILYVNRGFTREIPELKQEESAALLDFLFRHQEDPRFSVRIKWEPNTLTIWDNRSVIHRAIHDYAPQVRRGERVAVKGEKPFFISDAERNVSWALGGA